MHSAGRLLKGGVRKYSGSGEEMEGKIVLSGPRGDNPLGFLTALGALIVLQDGSHHPKLYWERLTPILLVDIGTSGNSLEESLIDRVYELLRKEAVRAPAKGVPDPVLVPGEKNVKFGFDKYESFIKSARDRYFKKRAWTQRRWFDMASFYGVFPEVRGADQDKIMANFWVLLEGSGHQDFFETVSSLILSVRKEHLKRTLFGPWDLQDDRLSLRLDPLEDRRYALMDVNPSSLGTKTLWGANRLAFEAFRFFTAVPIANGGRGVVGWKVERRGEPRTRWPLWRYPASPEVIWSVLRHPKIWQDDWEGLHAMGVSAVFEAKRINIDKYKNMTMGVPLWMEW
jgi:hypothetical protein